jgi:coenzyme PQQ biosynthesis protein PqqD
MDKSKRVCLKPDYILERIDGEITVYHPALTTSLYLNESGALIWQLCDGQNNIAHIIEILEETYPESREQIASDVIMILAELADKNIVDLID